MQNYLAVLEDKARELRHAKIAKDQIAIERSPELFDEIQRTAEREMALASLNRNWTISTQVSAAIERVANGTYGICTECDAPIGERRLQAIPWAGLCISCQEMFDQDDQHARLPLAA